jgi:peptide/nickel transport system ATP-binding protein
VLRTEQLSVAYAGEQGLVPAVREVSLTLAAGQTLGLVGESGSGKTTLALGAIGYLPPGGRVTGGASYLAGEPVAGRSPRELRAVWGSRIGLVSQNPQTALNPSMTIGAQLDESGRRHLGLSRAAARQASLSMLERVEMPNPRAVASRYPHQVSGGMLQRCAIAMALLTHPDLLILDEPTTALDVTTQAVILDLIGSLRAEFGMAILYITHNLGVVRSVCDRIAVMYAGEVFEEATAAELFERPLHPYTANLIRCLPRLGGAGGAGLVGAGPGAGDGRPADTPPLSTRRETRLATIPGSLPQNADLPPGCVFSPRCPLTYAECEKAPPPLIEPTSGRKTACIRWRLLLSDEGQRAAVRTDDRPLGSATPAAARPVTGRGRAAAGAAAAAPGEAAAAAAGGPSLLAVRGAAKVFPPSRAGAAVRAVDGASLYLDVRQTFGLVGESGSGKTTLARIVAGLTAPTGGRVDMDGVPVPPEVSGRDTAVLRRLQMVFQSPETSLNPRRTVGEALVRPSMLLAGLSRRAAVDRAYRLLEAVRLPAAYYDRYPGELSGGEKQRVAVARAFAAGPDVVICDEPVSSLDVSVQGALINLLVDLQNEAGTSYLFISHDLAAVEHLSHRIGVMYLGVLVEQGDTAAVLSPPHHPYTEALLSAVPDVGLQSGAARIRLRGSQPAGGALPSGCRFHPRCPRYLGDVCREQEPPWRLADGRVVAPGDLSPTTAAHAVCCHIPLEDLAALQGVG